MTLRLFGGAAALLLTFATGAPAVASNGTRSVTANAQAHDVRTATLEGRSILPAETYVLASERSGFWTTGNAAVPAPYRAQPVQGFSATHRLPDGSYLVMSDNGYGTKGNGADFLLAVHRIKPDTATGATTYVSTDMTLSDPHRLVPWTIWRDGGCAAASTLPTGYACPQIRDRKLTGSDFDIESMQVAPDGTFWFGEEFGPYLLHTDAYGRLLQAPVPTPGVMSPSNPTLPAGGTANIANSKGFEGLAISPDGDHVYPMLEGPTAEDKAAGNASDLRIFDASIASRRGARFTGRSFRYKMESPTNAIGDFIAVNDHQFLVIERDNGQGATAVFKRIYLVDTSHATNGGYVDKKFLVDLMNLSDPHNIGGMGSTFTFPFVTIEDVEIIDSHTIAVMNDNNFPATGGRSDAQPDQNEYLQIHLGRRLDVDKRLLASAVIPGQGKPGRSSFAVIGDVPYGDAQIAAFPRWIDQINEAAPEFTIHVGDIKNGSSRCDDPYYSLIKAQFNRFTEPLVYTPGDNEWTDCHRANNGSYNPLERLAYDRSVFFANPGTTLGANQMTVASQAAAGFPENVTFRHDRVEMAATHVVGSNNDLRPWTGIGKTTATPEQVTEKRQRMANAIRVVKQAFKTARHRQDRAVAIFQQADMFDPTYVPTDDDISAFTPLVQTLIDETSRFEGQVYLFDGDSHVYNVDEPLAPGSWWLTRYGVHGSVNNLTRVTVDGSAQNTDWLKVTITRPGSFAPLAWERQPYRP